jgi:hypothetical protein
MEDCTMKTFLKWRKMTCVLIVWCALIGIWLINGAVSTSGAVDDCVADGVLSRESCETASAIGSGIGITIILGIGFFGFVFLSLIWFMSRPRDKAVEAAA